MSDLKARIEVMIRADGPMPVSAYMDICLHDPKQGYYATRPGLGADFITAPEISQTFGELIGLWVAHEWQQMGSPDAFSLAELGPGRATLMSDALRATKVVPGFHRALKLHLVEASPALKAQQSEALGAFSPAFARDLNALPTGHTILLANEYLDCLPVRQFVQVGGAWQERVVGLGDAGELGFGLAVDTAPPNMSAPGDAAELQPGLDVLVDQLKARADMGDTFHALFIDYGPANATPGDTLRAYRAGEQIHPLAAPGESDLTVDVDFARLKRLAEAAGLRVHGPVAQGQFLWSLGMRERANALAKASPDHAAAIFDGVRRLVDPGEMGTRFQVICISSPSLAVPAAF